MFHSTLIPCLLHSSEADMPQNPSDHHLGPNYPPIISLSFSCRGLFPTHFQVPHFFVTRQGPPGQEEPLELPCWAMSKMSKRCFFFDGILRHFPDSVAAALRCNAIRRTDHLKFPVPIMAPGKAPLEKSLYKTKRRGKF